MWAELFASLPLATLAMLWAGGFLGGLASGAFGFAFGIASSAIWLHAIEPVHTTFLIVTASLVIQSGTLWPLRHALDWNRLWWFLLAGIIGVPIGVGILVHIDMRMMQIVLGVFLAIYGVYAMAAPRLPHVKAGRGADAVVGLIGGVMGGIGGYSGVAPAIWAQLRGWPKDMARTFYQPFIVVVHVVTLVALGTVAFDRKGLVLLVWTLPAVLAGAWVGWTIYGRIDEKRFRQMFAVILIVSGLTLIF